MSGISNYTLNQKINALLGKTSGLPSVIDLDTTLTTGNNAGANDIDMNNNDILQVNNIDLTTINGSAYPPTIPTPDLDAVLTTGNDANNQSILNALRYECSGASGQVRVGTGSGASGQGTSSIALGQNAGSTNQGNNAIAIGNNAGSSNQTAGSICLNASGLTLNPAVAGFFVNPIRADATEQLPLQYNSTTNEVSNFSWTDLLTPTSYNPILQSSGGSNLNSGNYSVRKGYYIQLGKIVWFEVRIQISGKGGLGSAGEDIRITLPITASSLTDLTQSLNIGNIVQTNTNIVSAFANIPSGGQGYVVFPIKTTASTGTTNCAVGNISSSFQIRFGGFYFTD